MKEINQDWIKPKDNDVEFPSYSGKGTIIEILPDQIGVYYEVNGYQVADVTLTAEQAAKLREHLEGVSPAAISYILTGKPEVSVNASN